MYKFSYFTEQDEVKVIEFMKENSFAIITNTQEDYPVATHIPLYVEEKDGKLFLHGHLMRKTDHHKAFEANNKVLVIFTGPHTYVSASWYNNTQVGSTWNYQTVHAKGIISFLDKQGTYDAVKSITNKYEPAESIAAFNQLSDEYVEHMVKAIVGFTIEVESFDNVFKLSQNRSEPERQNIMNKLRERGDAQSIAVAEEMSKTTAYKQDK